MDARRRRENPHRRTGDLGCAGRLRNDLRPRQAAIMAKLALIYGMRLLPADEIENVGEAEIKLKSGKTAHVTMHLIDGGEKEIRQQLEQSLDAFFEFYPEI